MAGSAPVTVGMFGSTSNRYGSVAGPKGLSVLALDPGETTGWAWAVVSYRELGFVWDGSWAWSELFARVIDGGRLESGQMEVYRGPMSASSNAVKTLQQEAHFAREIGGLVNDLHLRSKARSGGKICQVTDLVIEDFVLREQTKSRNLLAPVRLTAAIAQEVFTDQKLIGISIQSPSDAKSAVTDERLKALGLYVRGQQHARDALRHLALFLRRLNPD